MSGISRNLPNILSWGRLAVAPLTAFCILDGRLTAALALFSAAALTDALDGFLARRLRLESPFGRLIDPAADKLLAACAYLPLAIMGHLPWLLAILVVGRDLVIAAGWGWARASAMPLQAQPSPLGKLNTGLQFLAVVAALSSAALNLPLGAALTLLFWVTAATTLLSLAGYLRVWAAARRRAAR
jgi:cardiolipin synthase